LSTATEIVTSDGEVIGAGTLPSVMEAVTRAEVDLQIATAKRFPRSVDRFLKTAMAMVSVSPELAEECTYAKPQKDANGKDKVITGPSIRLAEILAVAWGNLRIGGRCTGDDGQAVTVVGVCHDLETNVAYSLEVRRGVKSKRGFRFPEHVVNNVINGGISIATRNATFKCIPRAFVNIVWQRAQAVARGDEASLPTRAQRALDWFATKGINESDVCQALGITGPADISLDHLTILQGFRTALQEESATVEEIFRRPVDPVTPERQRRAGESRSDELTRKLAGPRREGDGLEGSFKPGTPGKISTEDEETEEREPGSDG
jgi:hypothetical protein